MSGVVASYVGIRDGVQHFPLDISSPARLMHAVQSYPPGVSQSSAVLPTFPSAVASILAGAESATPRMGKRAVGEYIHHETSHSLTKALNPTGFVAA